MLRSVLFVEDESILRTIYQRQVGDVFDVDVAATPAEALEAVRTKHYGVVVSDMSMPGMNGIALLAAVRRLSPRTVPMILSAHSEQHLASAAEGVFRVLNKPCPRSMLLKSLKEGFQQYESLASPAAGLTELVDGTQSSAWQSALPIATTGRD